MITLLSALLFFGTIHENHAQKYSIPHDQRHTTQRSDSSEIVYYFTIPKTVKDSYPIAIVCEGSSTKGDLRSVWNNYRGFGSDFWPLGIATVGLEKWGIDGNAIDEKIFYEHYTWSQRYQDHMTVMQSLRDNPPQGWNGRFILQGASEGGPIVNRLTRNNDDVIATINWCGAGGWCWKEELWDWINHEWQNASWLKKMQLRIVEGTPATNRFAYDKIIHNIQEDPLSTIKRFSGHTYKYMADALAWDTSDYLHIKTPLLVVMGTMDPCIRSFDDFVHKANKAGVPITSMRIEGMDHDICDSRFTVIKDSFVWLKKQVKLYQQSPELWYCTTYSPHQWVRAWIRLWTNTTREEYQKFLGDIFNYWIVPRTATHCLISKAIDTPLTSVNEYHKNPKVMNLIKSWHFEDSIKLTMRSGSATVKKMISIKNEDKLPISINRLQELIVNQYIRIMEPLEKISHELADLGFPAAHGSGRALQILDTLTHLSLQKWAESNICEEQWALLFDTQYEVIVDLVNAIVLAPKE